jgi:multiple sugar transport system ATP-binding protein
MSDLISLRVHGDESMTIRALLPSDAHWSRENLELAIPPELVHWFDAETERRLT